MINATTAAKLRTIRRAGLAKVRRAAARQGITTVERDIQILRDIAHGSTNQAAEKAGICSTSVRRLLDKYAKIAEDILAKG